MSKNKKPMHERKKLTATEIGKMVGLDPMSVNKVLQRVGFMQRFKCGWELTEKGASYGRERSLTSDKKSGRPIAKYITWKLAVVGVIVADLRNFYGGLPPDSNVHPNIDRHIKQ